MEHSCSCKETDCPLSTCEKMRRVVNHYRWMQYNKKFNISIHAHTIFVHHRVCKQKEVGSCDVCKQLLTLCCYHAKQCKASVCSVPFCHSIRLNLQRRRLQEDASLQRRVAQMGITSEDAFNPFSDVSDVGGRQVMTGAHVKVGKNLVGMENASQQSRGKGIRFQTDSRGHMMSNSPNLDVQGKNLKRLSGEALESQVVPHSQR